jgi:ABC-type multidrug transport system ATPase subunit
MLGPNGAGKSTTISILIGKIKASLGRQYVAGQDVGVNMAAVHR